MMAGGAEAPPSSASLYVGDLDPSVGDADLFYAFTACGPMSSVHVCRDRLTGASLRYAYVNFISRSHAENALKTLNHTVLHGKPMRIMWSQRNPVSRKNCVANLFVKNLDPSTDGAKLEEMFAKYGNILSSKVVMDNEGKSRHFGFVQFDAEESAQAAIKALHGSASHGNRKLYVAEFVKKNERQSNATGFTNLYIKNLDDTITDNVLLQKFSEFGNVWKAVVVKDELGLSKGFGFVNFESPEHAKSAIEAMNGTQFGSKAVYVGRAQTRTERDKLLKQQSVELGEKQENGSQKIHDKYNVYVKNLHSSIGENDLREIFSGCGKITSTKVVRDEKGSRGFGFVSFSCLGEAERAVRIMNGTTIRAKRLFVAISQSKEERLRPSRPGLEMLNHLVLPKTQNPPLLNYPRQIPVRRQYQQGWGGIPYTSYGGEPTKQLWLPYQKGQFVYDSTGWLTGSPYPVHSIQNAPFVSQWYQHVNTPKNIVWLQPNLVRETGDTNRLNFSLTTRGS